MKAPNFSYTKPHTIQDAIEILARHEGAAVPMAGGQSLLAGLNMRLSAPDVIVDLTGLDELKGIFLHDDIIRIGALTRHVDLLRSTEVADAAPLIAKAIRYVAHMAVRNRGTIGGSVAYADPSAELPACIVALGATVLIAGPDGERRLAAENFFHGLFETDLQVGEIIVGFEIPRIRANQRWAFTELSRRRGDFAMAGLAALLDMSGDMVTDARLVYFGCTDYPRLAAAMAAALRGTSLPLADKQWIHDTLPQDVQPSPSVGMRPDTKLKLAVAVTEDFLADLSQPRAAGG